AFGRVARAVSRSRVPRAGRADAEPVQDLPAGRAEVAVSPSCGAVAAAFIARRPHRMASPRGREAGVLDAARPMVQRLARPRCRVVPARPGCADPQLLVPGPGSRVGAGCPGSGSSQEPPGDVVIRARGVAAGLLRSATEPACRPAALNAR